MSAAPIRTQNQGSQPAATQNPASLSAPLHTGGSGNRYFVCCDGTSNEPTGQSLNDTNPYRLAQICAPKDGPIFQIVGYQQGIGTVHGQPSDNSVVVALGNLWDQGLGDGLDYNSFKVCQWLASKGCTANSDVVLCGFSRGSFTIRIVAQYINDVGLLDIYQGEPIEEYTQRLWVAYYGWFLSKAGSAIPDYARDRAYAGLATAKGQIPKHTQSYAPPFKPRSLTLALFDTVGTAGVPAEFGTDINALKDQVQAFQNRWHWLPEQLPPAVTWARHAVALGEKRKLFPPHMMGAAGRCDLAQRWFPGAHTAVGGGDITLANCVASLDPLAWMIGELQDARKVLFDTQKVEQMVSLIANQDTVNKVTALPTSTVGLLWQTMGNVDRTPGRSSNEYVQTPTDPFQQRMSKAGSQIDVRVPSNVKAVDNSKSYGDILSLLRRPTKAVMQIAAIARTSWIPAASTQIYIAEYKELTGIGDKGFRGFDSTNHPLNPNTGASSYQGQPPFESRPQPPQAGSGTMQYEGPKYPSPLPYRLTSNSNQPEYRPEEDSETLNNPQFNHDIYGQDPSLARRR